MGQISQQQQQQPHRNGMAAVTKQWNGNHDTMAQPAAATMT